MLHDYKQQGMKIKQHVLLLTQDEWDAYDPRYKGFTIANNEVQHLWLVRHQTMFPVAILPEH